MKRKYYSKISLVGLYISLPLLLFTYKFGLNINEASRWINIPIINPPGGHAVYIDAKNFLNSILNI